MGCQPSLHLAGRLRAIALVHLEIALVAAMWLYHLQPVSIVVTANHWIDGLAGLLVLVPVCNALCFGKLGSSGQFSFLPIV